MTNLVYAQTNAAPAKANPLGAMGSYLPIILIFAIFYFLLIRPQQKQQRLLRKMISEVKKGDEIVTMSGLHGTVVETKDDNTIMVQVSNNVILKMERPAIQKIKGYQPS